MDSEIPSINLNAAGLNRFSGKALAQDFPKRLANIPKTLIEMYRKGKIPQIVVRGFGGIGYPYLTFYNVL